MRASLFTGFQNSKKKLLRLLLSSLLAVVVVILMSILLIAIDFIRDIYPESIVKVHPSAIMQPELASNPEINYFGLMIGSSISVSTESNSSQVSSWYAEKGWEPLGRMWQYGEKHRIGKFTLSTFKVMQLSKESIENGINGQLVYGLSESYEICYCDRR